MELETEDTLSDQLSTIEQGQRDLKRERCDSVLDSQTTTASPEQHPEPPAKKTRGSYHCHLGHSVVFTTQRALSRHVKEQHSASSTYFCPACGQSFARPSDLTRHKREVHDCQGRRNAIPGIAPSYRPLRNPETVGVTKVLKTESTASTLSKITETPLLVHELTVSSTEHVKEAAIQHPAVHRLKREKVPLPGTKTQRGNDFLETCSDVDVETLNEALFSLSIIDNPLEKIHLGASLGQESVVSVQCPVCQKRFRDAALFSNCMKAHLENPLQPHICKRCNIGFTRRVHLDYHLQSSRTRTCGFNFKHYKPCTGHHQLTRDNDVDHHAMEIWYLLQLRLNAAKTLEKLDAAAPKSCEGRWSFSAACRRRLSEFKMPSTLNAAWSSPATFRRSKGSEPSRKWYMLSLRKAQERFQHWKEATRQDEMDEELRSCVESEGPVDRVQRLLKAGANAETRMLKNGRCLVPSVSSLLSVSLEREHDDIVQVLLDHGADVRFPAVRRYLRNNDAKLGVAARLGQLGLVRVLLGCGANVNESDASGDTALHHAVFWDRGEVVDVLLEHGADVHLRGTHGDALTCAVRTARPSMVERIAKYGASVDDYFDEHTEQYYALMGSACTRPSDAHRLTKQALIQFRTIPE